MSFFTPFAFIKETVPSGFPDQSLGIWTSAQALQWLSYGNSVCNTTTFAYSGSTERIGNDYGSQLAKYLGGSLAANGKIYAPPHLFRQWAIIDTNIDTVVTSSTLLPTDPSSQGSVYDKITNTVYAVGKDASKVDCSTDIVSTISGPPNRSTNPIQGFDGDYLYSVGFSVYTGARKYQISTNTTTTITSPGAQYGEMATLGWDNCMYIPNLVAGSNLLKYDLAAETATNLALGGGTFATVVQHYDGYIYLLPVNDPTGVIKRLDLNTGTFTTVATLNNYGCSNAAIGLDGRIYIVSSASTGIKAFNPVDNSISTITIANGDSSFAGITLGANGDLYLIPWTGNYFHKLRLTTGTGTTATDIVSQYNFGGRMVWPG